MSEEMSKGSGASAPAAATSSQRTTPSASMDMQALSMAINRGRMQWPPGYFGEDPGNAASKLLQDRLQDVLKAITEAQFAVPPQMLPFVTSLQGVSYWLTRVLMTLRERNTIPEEFQYFSSFAGGGYSGGGGGASEEGGEPKRRKVGRKKKPEGGWPELSDEQMDIARQHVKDVATQHPYGHGVDISDPQGLPPMLTSSAYGRGVAVALRRLDPPIPPYVAHQRVSAQISKLLLAYRNYNGGVSQRQVAILLERLVRNFEETVLVVEIRTPSGKMTAGDINMISEVIVNKVPIAHYLEVNTAMTGDRRSVSLEKGQEVLLQAVRRFGDALCESIHTGQEMDRWKMALPDSTDISTVEQFNSVVQPQQEATLAVRLLSLVQKRCNDMLVFGAKGGAGGSGASSAAGVETAALDTYYKECKRVVDTRRASKSADDCIPYDPENPIIWRRP